MLSWTENEKKPFVRITSLREMLHEEKKKKNYSVIRNM